MTGTPARLGDVVAIEREMIAPANIRSGTLYVGLEHIESSGAFVGVRPVQSGDLASTKFGFDSSHVLYGKLRPYLCKIARPDFAGVCTTEVVPLRPGPRVDRNYLYHFLRQPRMVEFATARCSGANLPRLSPKQLAEFEIPLPNIAEQRRIAAVLDAAEALVAKRRQALATLATLCQSVFLDMFGDTSKIPGLRITTLNECAEIASGVTMGRRLGGRPTIHVPYLRVANVQDGHLDLDEIKTIEALPEDLEALRLRSGDVLLTEGGDFDKLGRGAVWDHQISDCIHQNHVFRVRPTTTLMLPRYFEAFLQSCAAKAYFLRCAKKTTNLASINMTQLRALPVTLPPVHLQQKFSQVVTRADRAYDDQESALKEMRTLFGALQSRAFSGALGAASVSVGAAPTGASAV